MLILSTDEEAVTRRPGDLALYGVGLPVICPLNSLRRATLPLFSLV
jgi:hypothetical protein